jgi:hypothetical protein
MITLDMTDLSTYSQWYQTYEKIREIDNQISEETIKCFLMTGDNPDKLEELIQERNRVMETFIDLHYYFKYCRTCSIKDDCPGNIQNNQKCLEEVPVKPIPTDETTIDAINNLLAILLNRKE